MGREEADKFCLLSGGGGIGALEGVCFLGIGAGEDLRDWGGGTGWWALCDVTGLGNSVLIKGVLLFREGAEGVADCGVIERIAASGTVGEGVAGCGRVGVVAASGAAEEDAVGREAARFAEASGVAGR